MQAFGISMNLLTFNVRGFQMRRTIYTLALLSILLTIHSARGQEDPLKYADLGDLRLGNGQIIQECRIGYRTFGTLNSERSNAILFPTWFTCTTEGLIDLVGPGKLVDSFQYFIIAVDALGNGVSSSPSNSKTQPGTVFPTFTIRDMAETQYKLLTQEFDLSHLYTVIGISMGGTCRHFNNGWFHIPII